MRNLNAHRTDLYLQLPCIVQTSDTLKTETDFQLNVNEYYHIVKLAVIVEICRQTELMMSF